MKLLNKKQSCCTKGDSSIEGLPRMEDLIEQWVTDLPESIPYLLRLVIRGVPADQIEKDALDRSIQALVDKIAVCEKISFQF